MEKLKISIIIFTMLMINSFVYAQGSATDLDGYLEIAALNNPGVKAAYNEYLAALEKVPQVGSLPDPQATFGYFIKPMQLIAGNQIADIQLMQMFPWFGTLKAAKDEASLMAKAKYESFNATKAELFYDVKSDWYQLMKYDREIALIKNNVELLKALEKLTLIKFQSPDGGNSSSNMNGKQTGLQDVLRVRMEILDQQNHLALLADQRRTEEAKFNALLNRDQGVQVVISDSLAVQPLLLSKEAIADSIISKNPMLSMLEDQTGSYASMEQKAKRMGWPMLGLGLKYMPIQKREGNTSMMNGKDMFMPMVSLSIPIYRKKYTAMQNEARLMQEAGDQQTIDLKNNLMVQYRQFIQNLDDAERRIALYREQEELAKKSADLLLSGFTTTGNDFEEVLRMQLKVLDYSFYQVEAIVDYNTSVAMAEKLMNSLKY